MKTTIDPLRAMQDLINTIQGERLSPFSFAETSSSSEDMQEVVDPLDGMRQVINQIRVDQPSLVSLTIKRIGLSMSNIHYF